MQSSNGRRWAKFPLVVLLPGFIQQQFRLFPDMEKKIRESCEVNRLERLHFLCEPHSLAKYGYEFFLEHFIHNNARGITILSS